MSNKNLVRTALSGLGVAGGAVLAAALTPVAIASADDDIDGHSGTFDSNITTSGSGPAIDIFDNKGFIGTNIYGTAPNSVDDVTIEHNWYTSEIITNIYGTGAGTQNLVNIDDNLGYVGTAIVGGSGSGSSTEAFIFGNSGQTVTKITDGTSVSATIYDNSGSADVTTVSDPAGGDITLYGNTDQQAVDLLGNSGAYTITVVGGTGAVTINDGSDLAPIFVGVDVGTLGHVSADVEGVITAIPAGDEYEFVNGAVDVISTTF